MRPSILLAHKHQELKSIFSRYPFATNPRIFGSVARGEDNENSDLDIMIDILPFTSLFAVARLQDELECLFPEIKIDLIDAKSFRGNGQHKIEQEAIWL